MTPACVAAGVWLGLFALYLHGVPGTFYFEDSPELLACAAVLGNTHDPGYPLLMLMGKLALGVPVGSLAFRFNLMVALFGALAAVILGGFMVHLCRRWGSLSVAVLVAFFATGIWGLSDAFWWQAVIGDKYPLFYLTFISILWFSWAAGNCNPERIAGHLVSLGLLGGVAFAHHQYSVFSIPCFIYAFARVFSLAPQGRLRIAAFVILLSVLPYSTKILYPPIRAVAGVELNWGNPGTSERLAHHLLARRYHKKADSELTSVTRSPLGSRFKFVWRFIFEEFPFPVLLGFPVGAVLLMRRVPGFSLALLGCVIANLFYVTNLAERIVRWYQPLYVVLVLVSALGIAGVIWRVQRVVTKSWLLVPLTLLVCLSVLWQWTRGADRNDLSRFTSAHDYARNLLLSLPRGAIYLGRGDTDLFPLWVMRFVEHEREDVVAVGLSSFVDENPADTAGQERVFKRMGFRAKGWNGVRRILDPTNGFPIMIGKTGYPTRLWNDLSSMLQHRGIGVAARITPGWDLAGSYKETARVLRGYTFRGLLYSPVGAVFDRKRMRDEMLHDGLFHYAMSFWSLGLQFAFYGNGEWDYEAAWAFRWARRLLEPFTGPLFVAPPSPLYPPAKAKILAESDAVATGLYQLARMYEDRGIKKRAARYRSLADILTQRLRTLLLSGGRGVRE